MAIDKVLQPDQRPEQIKPIDPENEDFGPDSARPLDMADTGANKDVGEIDESALALDRIKQAPKTDAAPSAKPEAIDAAQLARIRKALSAMLANGKLSIDPAGKISPGTVTENLGLFVEGDEEK